MPMFWVMLSHTLFVLFVLLSFATIVSCGAACRHMTLTHVLDHAGAAGAPKLEKPSSVLWTASGVAVAGGLNFGTFEHCKLSLHSGLRLNCRGGPITNMCHLVTVCTETRSTHMLVIRKRGGAAQHAASQQHKYLLSSA